jgi:arylsulfatase A-like enzyme
MRFNKILFFLFFFFPVFLSAQWEIKWDSTAIQKKQAYLSTIKKNTVNKPNIILIVADDLGKYDLSIYGNLLIKTPHIDQLAIDGAICTNGYATAPICSPSRAGMLTGRYQQRFGYQFQPQQRYPRSRFEWWAFTKMNTSDLEPAPYQKYPSKNDVQKQGLPPSEITIAEILKASGYATAWIGKWHLGYHEPVLPGNFGFDYQYGCYEAFTLYANPAEKNIVNARIDEFTDKHIWNGGRKGACAIRRNGELTDEKEYLTYAFGREAKQFISNHTKDPFFLYLPITAPHTPYQAPKNIYDSLSFINDHNKRVYYSMIIALDKMVGDLVTHLKSEGLYQNTLIIFTSDNGAALYSRTVTNEPLVGGKFTFYEGGINVPLIFHYPGKIQPKTQLDQSIMLFDLYTTILDVVQIQPIPNRTIDGESLVPWLMDNRKDKIHENLFWYSEYNRAIQSGKWKLIVNTLDNTIELYNLDKQGVENKELSIDHPTLIKSYTLTLDEWLQQLPPPLWPRLVDYQLRVNGKLTKWGV